MKCKKICTPNGTGTDLKPSSVGVPVERETCYDLQRTGIVNPASLSSQMGKSCRVDPSLCTVLKHSASKKQTAPDREHERGD